MNNPDWMERSKRLLILLGRSVLLLEQVLTLY